jgi:hypothetical protein
MSMSVVWAALAYIIPTFPLGYVWHLTIFKERYAALNIYRPDLSPPLGLGSMIIQGIIFGWIYVGLIAPMEGSWMVKALTYAALGGILSWSFTTVAAAAKSPMTSVRDFVAIETAFTALQWIVVGIVTALVVPA